MNNLNIKKYLLLLIINLTLVSFSSASSVSIDSDFETVGINQIFIVSVQLSTEEKNINAIKGSINIPDYLDVVSINSGNSLVSLWTSQPSFKDDNISFVGIIPGGYTGDGILFSLILKSNQQGDFEVSFDDIEILLHDGLGTSDEVGVSGLNIVVDSNITESSIETEDDNQDPEHFNPVITSDPSIFDGDLFIVFSTKDKISGIDRYEIVESNSKLSNITDEDWITASSPYRIENQKLNKDIYIRAIDNFGNTRLVQAHTSSGNSRVWILCIIVIVMLRVLYIRKRKNMV